MKPGQLFNIQHLSSKLKKVDYALLLALVLPIFAVMPLLTHAGLPNTADGPVHLMRQVELNQAWQEGNFYPRWGADLALGHGMPIFSYAPPSLYQLTQLFHLSGLPLDEAMKGVLVLDFILYSLGMFLFTRRLYGPVPALVAAAVYVYAPYRLREAYIQGNYGQFTGLAFYPLIFWAFHGLITAGRPGYLIAAALSLAGLLFSHNISAMLFAPIFGAYLVFLLLLQISRPVKMAEETTGSEYQDTSSASRFALSGSSFTPFFLRTVVATILGLGLAAIFWLPAFGERDQIKLEGITRGFFDFRENFIHLSEFLAPPQPLDLSAINPEFPLSLGLPQIIGAGLGIISLFWFIRKATGRPGQSSSRNLEKEQPPAPSPTSPFSAHRFAHTLFFTLFLLLYTFLALPYSRPVWEAVPLLELTEFPWRMLGPAIFCAAVLSASALAMIAGVCQSKPSNRPLNIDRSRSLFIAHCSLLVVNCSLFIVIALNAYYLYPSQFIPWGTPTPADAFAYEAASGAIGTTSTGEFLPRSAQQHPRPETLGPDYRAGRPPQKLDPATLPAGATVDIIDHRAEADRFRISTPTEFTATLRTLYWPGWQLYLNGQPLPFSVTPQTGLIQATIPPGQHTLTLTLESTPLRTVGQWLTVVSAVILLLIGILAPSTKQPATAGRTSGNPISAQFFAITAVILVALYFLSRPLAPFFTLQSDPDRPIPANRLLSVDFGGQIRLVGMDTVPRQVDLTPPDPSDLEVTVYWRALKELDTNYSVFLHLDAPNGQTFATADEVNPEDIPTRNWPPGLYLRNLLHLKIPGNIPPIRYDLNVGWYNRENGERLPVSGQEDTTFTLGSVWLTAPRPELTGPPLARFGPAITLLQAEYVPTGQPSLTLYWQTGQPIDQNYSIFVHLLDREGNLLDQVDGLPYDGLYPPASWQPDQIITDVRALPSLVPADQLASIAIGFYDPATGHRLPATDAQGQTLPNNSFTIPVAP